MFCSVEILPQSGLYCDGSRLLPFLDQQMVTHRAEGFREVIVYDGYGLQKVLRWIGILVNNNPKLSVRRTCLLKLISIWFLTQSKRFRGLQEVPFSK